jgi:hypothetical protein
MKSNDINEFEDFVSIYGIKESTEILEFICEAFYSKDFKTITKNYKITEHEEDSSGNPPDFTYYFTGEIVFRNNEAFYFSITEGNGSGTTVDEFYFDKESTAELKLENMKRKIKNFKVDI